MKYTTHTIIHIHNIALMYSIIMDYVCNLFDILYHKWKIVHTVIMNWVWRTHLNDMACSIIYGKQQFPSDYRLNVKTRVDLFPLSKLTLLKYGGPHLEIHAHLQKMIFVALSYIFSCFGFDSIRKLGMKRHYSPPLIHSIQHFMLWTLYDSAHKLKAVIKLGR